MIAYIAVALILILEYAPAFVWMVSPYIGSLKSPSVTKINVFIPVYVYFYHKQVN